MVKEAFVMTFVQAFKQKYGYLTVCLKCFVWRDRLCVITGVQFTKSKVPFFLQEEINKSDTVRRETSLVRCPALMNEQECKL